MHAQIFATTKIFALRLITEECSVAMSRQCVTANGSGAVCNRAGITVLAKTGLTGLTPGRNVSVRPIIPHRPATSGHVQQSKGAQATSQLTNQVISKVFLKAVSKSGGKIASNFKTFMLRNIDTCSVSTCSQSRALAWHKYYSTRLQY